ncbi:G-protein coupled receptor [Haematobia irritans]|uniref:G-protein coupled receptor n=1 Tax=Haematobia irritans TaxID=7368 RepID=UPI003F508E5F
MIVTSRQINYYDISLRMARKKSYLATRNVNKSHYSTSSDATTANAMTRRSTEDEHTMDDTLHSVLLDGSFTEDYEVFSKTFRLNITNDIGLPVYDESTYNSTNTNQTNKNTLGEEDEDNDILHTIEYIGEFVYFYYVPFIVGFGSLGNILSVVVFFRTKLRNLSSSFYLAALAVSDTCFLFGLFVQWLDFFNIHLYNQEYFCQFFTFFSSLACFCSVWFVVAFTVERYIAVMYPLKRQTVCTVQRAKMVLLVLTILGCLHCGPFWLSSTPAYSMALDMTICDIRHEYTDYITLLNYWDTIVVFAVPFTVIAILNTLTGLTVWKFASARKKLTMQKITNRGQQTHVSMTSQVTMALVKTNITPTTTTLKYSTEKCTIMEDSLKPSHESKKRTAHATAARSMKKTSLKESKKYNHGGEQINSYESHVVEGCLLKPHHHHRSSINQHQHKHQRCHRQSTRSSSSDFRDSRCKQKTAMFADTSTSRAGTGKSSPSQYKITKMLLVVSSVFVCLNLPSCVMRMITFIEAQNSSNQKSTVVLQYIFHLLFITNFGINFILYCMSGQNFRSAAKSMFRRMSKTQRDGTTQITVSECHRNSVGGGVCGQSSGLVNTTATINAEDGGIIICTNDGCIMSTRASVGQCDSTEVGLSEVNESQIMK